MLTRYTKDNKRVIIRGSGDIATGIAVRLYNCGYQVIMTDIARPTMIRCSVAFGQCLFDGVQNVEGITACHAKDYAKIEPILAKGQIPVLVDPNLSVLKHIQANYLVDAILAKTNLGFHKDLAPITIALGPGFEAGIDCDAVIETNRGHYLGRVIYQGKTQANTGVPGNIAGFTYERVIRSPCAGVVTAKAELGDIVNEGDCIATVGSTAVYAPLSGMLRGMINDNIEVVSEFKIADIDPRGEKADHLTVSDKARAIGGSVLEAMLHLSLGYERKS